MKIAGQPDFVFPAERVVVFIHGDFWRGNHGPPVVLAGCARSYDNLDFAPETEAVRQISLEIGREFALSGICVILNGEGRVAGAPWE